MCPRQPLHCGAGPAYRAAFRCSLLRRRSHAICMEWVLAVLCMIPAAVLDVRTRSFSLESCVATLLVGCAVFALWALEAPPLLAVAGGAVTGAMAVVGWLTHRYGGAGDGDMWFIAGVSAALVTVDVTAPILAIVCWSAAMAVWGTVMCVVRPGVPFPRRLLQHVKRGGDRFRVSMEDGSMVPEGESGMLVRPALPMVAFIAPTVLAVGVFLSL